MHGVNGYGNIHNIMNDEYMKTRKNLTNGLKELWNEYNSNKAGDSATKIDKSEMIQKTSAIFFVEEGMTEQEFCAKNYEVYEAFVTGESTKSSRAVSKLVKEMIENGEFEAKRDVILGKLNYLDAETRMLVEQEEDTLKSREETKKELEKTEPKSDDYSSTFGSS